MIALKKGDILLVECRTDGVLLPEERRKILQLADSIGGKPFIALREGRRLMLKPVEE